MSEHPYHLHRETFMSHKAAVLQLACTLLSYITQVLLLQVFQLSYLQHNFFSAQKSCIIFLGKVGNISDMSIFTWVRKTKKLKHSLYQLWVLNIYQPANQREVKGGIGTGSKFKFTLSQHKGGVPQALSQPTVSHSQVLHLLNLLTRGIIFKVKICRLEIFSQPQ